MELELVVHDQHALAEIENAGVIITATLRDSTGVVRAEGTGPLDRGVGHIDGTWASLGCQNDNVVFCVAGDQGRVQLNPDVDYTLTIRVKSPRRLESRIEVLPRLYSATFFGT